MEISVQLRPDVATGTSGSPEGSELRQVMSTVADLGARLEPVHPGEDDPVLARHFRVEVHDQETAERVIGALQQNRAVEGAYVKPEAELP